MTEPPHPERAVEPDEQGENRSGSSPPEPMNFSRRSLASAACMNA
jgi:hypothetical protein